MQYTPAGYSTVFEYFRRPQTSVSRDPAFFLIGPRAPTIRLDSQSRSSAGTSRTGGATTEQEKDCLGCRLIGASAAILAGSYILAHEIQRRRHALILSKPLIPARPIGARCMQLIGWSFIGLGVARAIS
ncbi:hypothetical protein PGTUg99_037174 [Puccinia graminis f. sp. tritici]|uniref:DUF4536 domain-containing protein n=1 Tax=Puccinia graminis f. sp. tritici TaxID=56615 RepID=A0A5B0SHG6_PUCGR|nr:hypothetical protein PGTUg99_037174 [Puccinia graminis f. sp. tritici]